MNYICKIYYICIVNKAHAFHYWENKFSDTDNINSTLVTTVIVEKCFR